MSTVCSVGKPINWAEFWPLFREYALWDLEWFDGSEWVSVKPDLTVKRTYPEPHHCKYSLVFDASHAGNYRLTFAVSRAVRGYVERVDKWQCELTYEDAMVTFDWSDCKDIAGLQFSHGVKDNYFWFRIRRDNVPLGAHVEIDPSTVGTSTSTFAVYYPWQRLCFYAFGRFWVFYSNGTNLVYQTSTDGAAWSGETIVRACTAGREFTAWFDGTYLHYSYCLGADGDPILYRRGTPNADGSISWSAVEQTAVAGAGGVIYSYPFVSVDSEGYIWIGYRRTEGGSSYPYATVSGNNDGTWGTTPGGFPYQLNAVTHPTWRSTVVPLTGRKVLAVYARYNSFVRARRWTGVAWGDEKTSTSVLDIENFFSAVAEPDDAHIVFSRYGTPPNSLRYIKYTYATDSFGAETELESVMGFSSAPVIAIDGDNYLYVFWTGVPTADHIYYRRWNGAAWDARVDWVDETALDITSNYTITGHYGAYSGYIALVWLATLASPYDVRHEFLSGLTAFTPVTVYPGWTGKIAGVTNPAKIMGVDVANIAKVKGVASA